MTTDEFEVLPVSRIMVGIPENGPDSRTMWFRLNSQVSMPGQYDASFSAKTDMHIFEFVHIV